MMSSCCTLRLKRRRAFSRDSLSWIMTSATLVIHPQSDSDLRRVFVLTQYKALSLNRHIRAGWSPLAGLGDYIEVLPPQMRVSQQWYQGTADAVYQNIYSIGSERSKYVFILSGDLIYKMNYSRMLKQHVDSGADVTVATIQIPMEQAALQFGVI